jgi:hypothetical protein
MTSLREGMFSGRLEAPRKRGVEMKRVRSAPARRSGRGLPRFPEGARAPLSPQYTLEGPPLRRGAAPVMVAAVSTHGRFHPTPPRDGTTLERFAMPRQASLRGVATERIWGIVEFSSTLAYSVACV